jgi:hypothetical protein
MTKHVPAEVFPSGVVVTHGHPSVQTVAMEVRAPGLTSPREPRIQVHVVGLHAAVHIYAPELAETQTQLGAAHHRLVLGLVSRVVGVTQWKVRQVAMRHPNLAVATQVHDTVSHSPGCRAPVRT